MKEINWKILFTTVIGTALEFYDFVIYGFLAPIIAPLFFPTGNPTISFILSLGVFALGFLARPLGGFVFGHIGDRYGRKKALAFSVILMALPTFLIGLLPTYSQIGFFAPLLLVNCRLLQGICTGGEYNGAGIFVVEHTKDHKKGFVSGVLISGCVIGMLIGSGVSMIVSSLSFSWRIPFLLGIMPGILGYYIRRSVNESPAFEKIRKHQNLSQNLNNRTPIKFLNVLRVAGIASFAAALFYFQFILLNSFMPQVSSINSTDMIKISSAATVGYLFFLILMGWVSDYIGHITLMKIAALITIIFYYPLFYFALNSGIMGVILFQFFSAFLLGSYISPSHAVMVKLFPIEKRYSSISISYSVGLSLFGGTAPMFAMILYHQTNLATAPAFYIILCAAIGFLAVYQLPSATTFKIFPFFNKAYRQ
ncbi:MAG: MFS transporter [Alphaproteobacteria bacterium]|nr:MFS transporter [Alphaproteobacteria bacterium]